MFYLRRNILLCICQASIFVFSQFYRNASSWIFWQMDQRQKFINCVKAKTKKEPDVLFGDKWTGCQVLGMAVLKTRATGVINMKFQVTECNRILKYFQSNIWSLYLNGFLLIYPKAVHQSQNLFIKLPNGWLIFLPLWIENRSLYGNFYEHPFMLLDLRYG